MNFLVQKWTEYDEGVQLYDGISIHRDRQSLDDYIKHTNSKGTKECYWKPRGKAFLVQIDNSRIIDIIMNRGTPHCYLNEHDPVTKRILESEEREDYIVN